MNFETIDINCQECKTSEKRPTGLYFNYQARLDPSMDEFLSDNKSAERFLQGCSLSIENYENIIAVGPDSIVFVDDMQDPTSVIKLYFETSYKRLLQYQGEIREFNREFQGKPIILFDREFLIKANPVINIKHLFENRCVATLSEYIPGENEYERFRREYTESEVEDKQMEVVNYEREVHEALGKYIDPRNFKVNEEDSVVIITDLISSFKNQN